MREKLGPVTLPAQSLSDTDQHDEGPSNRDIPWPIALIAVVGVGALVIILCVLGAAVSGLFGPLGGSDDTATAASSPGTTTSVHTPVTQFGDGQYLVNRDIVAGTYETTVPQGSPGCTWERNSTTDGTASSVLEAGVGQVGEKIAVDVKETDKVFQTRGCGTWVRSTK